MLIELAPENKHLWANDKRRDKRDRILDRMVKGQKFESACRSVGIDPSTGRRWKQLCVNFRQQTMMARFLAKTTPRIDKLMRENKYLLDESEKLKAGKKQAHSGP